MNRSKKILQLAYFPLVVIIFIGAEIYLRANDLAFGYTLFLMTVALLLSFSFERLVPYKQGWNKGQNDTLRDTLHFLVNEGMNYSGILLLPFIAPFTSLAVFPELWPSSWSFGYQLLFAVVIFDIATTLFHYLSHKNPFLWRFHAVHHSTTRLYGFNGIMKHPIFQAMDAVFALGPLLVIGLPQDVAVSLVFCVFIQLLIQHSNVDIKTGWFRHVFATAEVHRFHHLKGKAGDVNFALFFSFWDGLLGTSHFESRKPLGNEEIGIGNTDYPVEYWEQIKKPFSSNYTITDV